MKDQKIRMIAAYMPHEGYGEEELFNQYIELDKIIKGGRNAGRKIILGGDFQTDPDEILRGSFMQAWAYGHHL
eukprot:11015682-Karenia_brevis.AAC.1